RPRAGIEAIQTPRPPEHARTRRNVRRSLHGRIGARRGNHGARFHSPRQNQGPNMNKPSKPPPRPPAFTTMIEVLLAEDHMVVRQGLRAMLEAEGDIKVI